MNSPKEKSAGPNVMPVQVKRQAGRANQSSRLPNAVQQKPAGSSQTKTPPVAPSAYRPQPVPRVMQRKANTGAQRTIPSGGSLVIQPSRQDRPRYTQVKATGGGESVTGYSSRGPRRQSIPQLLRTARSADAGFFLYILQNVRPLSDRGDHRTGFSCAEPHAVALLLAKGVALSEIQVGAASDASGQMAECPVCLQWLNGGSVDIEAWSARYRGRRQARRRGGRQAQAQQPEAAADFNIDDHFWPTPGEAKQAGLYDRKK